MLKCPPLISTKWGLFLLCSLKPPSSKPSNADGMSLTVKVRAVLLVSALVTAEAPGVRALLAFLISASLGVGNRFTLLIPLFGPTVLGPTGAGKA